MRALSVSLVGLVLVAGALRAYDPTKQGPAYLQGTWKIVSVWQDGQKQPIDYYTKLRMVIEGNKGQITVEGPYYDTKDSALSVTGGTGDYSKTQGQMKLHARDQKGTEYDFVYILED